MTTEIVLLLAQDGITNGAIYVLLAICLVLIYSTTRIVFVPQGEFVTYGAMTLAAIQSGSKPTTPWIVLVLSIVVGIIAIIRKIKGKSSESIWRTLALYFVTPILGVIAFEALPLQSLPYLAQVCVTFLAVTPLGPLTYRLFFEPIANSSVLLLLIVAVALHLALTGMGLFAFGPEGVRTTPLTSGAFDIGLISISGQSLAMIVASFALIAALFLLFERSLYGKALRATASSRLGARIVGIRPRMTGSISFLLAAAIGTASGVLISPLTTIYYDSGLFIALKGFVGAIIGGLISYPLAAGGALIVGLLESFSSFWASSYKEAIVFTLIIPVLLWRSFGSTHVEEE